MRLGIGTAQFGMDYGISNKEGQTSLAQIIEILNLAEKYEIKVLDTAAQYGNSEERLGKALAGRNNFKVVTKTPHFNVPAVTSKEAAQLKTSFYNSLKKLKKCNVYALLIHNANDLLTTNGKILFKEMVNLKRNKLVKKIGVSIYNSNQLENILNKYDIDIVQLPVNVLDQRFLKNGYIKTLKSKGIEIHARSIFLQGLLLMKLEDLPAYFKPISNLLKQYFNEIKNKGVTRLEASLNFVKQIKEIDYIIIGVNNHKQLYEIIEAYKKSFDINYKKYDCDNENIINPGKWLIS